MKPTKLQIAEFLTDNIISEITRYLMEDFGYPLENALDTVYSSHILELLQHKSDELYVQSPAYIYELLLKEKGLGVVDDAVNGGR